jgi:hypothetical protein
MSEQKMIVEYIRKGYPGKRIVKDGVEFFQRHRGPRIGVFVALNAIQFGWSLVHLKGENRESAKDVSWKKGVEMAIARAEGKTDEKAPDSIRREFASFKKRATMIFTEKFFPIEGLTDGNASVAVKNDEGERQFTINFTKGSLVRMKDESFQKLYAAMQKALAENSEN